MLDYHLFTPLKPVLTGLRENKAVKQYRSRCKKLCSFENGKKYHLCL